MFKTKNYNNYSYTIIKNQDILDLSIQRTSTTNVIIPHVCNNANAFGAGFAGYISSRYPHVKENFHLLGNKSKLGYSQFVDIYTNKQTNNKVFIANMISQNGLINKTNKRPLNYFALCNSMNTVSNYAHQLINQDQSTKVEIHSPKFGSGLAGGDWQFISELITDIWSHIPVYIYIK